MRPTTIRTRDIIAFEFAGCTQAYKINKNNFSGEIYNFVLFQQNIRSVSLCHFASITPDQDRLKVLNMKSVGT